MKSVITLFLSLLICHLASGQFKRLNQKEETLVAESRDYLEGYAQTIDGKSVSNKLVAECSSPEIEWVTSNVGKTQKKRNVNFMVKVDLTMSSARNKFAVFIDNQQRFTIPGSGPKDWQIKGEDGSSLSFQYFQLEGKTLSGYLIFAIPSEWLQKGSPSTIRIEYQCTDDEGMLMIHEDENALSILRKKANIETWIDIKLTNEGNSQNLEVSAPPEYSGKMFEFVMGNSIRGRKLSILREGRAYVSFTVKNSKTNTDGMSLEVISNGESLFVFPDIYKAKTVTLQQGDVTTEMEGSMYLAKTWSLEVRKLYRPD